MLQIQLHTGNMLTNFKWSYVRDYEIALCNYFSTSCKVFGSYNAYLVTNLTFADYFSEITSKVSSLTNDFITFTRFAQPVVNQTEVYKVGYEWCDAVKNLATKWDESLKSGKFDKGFNYIDEFADINKIYGKRMEDFDLPISNGAVPERFHFCEKLKMEYLPLPISGSEKVAKTIKKSNKVIESVGYVLIWANGLVNSHDTVASIATFASIDHEYDNSLTVLQSIIDYSNIEAMNTAAKNLKKTVNGDRESFADVWKPLVSSAVETGKDSRHRNSSKSRCEIWTMALGY